MPSVPMSASSDVAARAPRNLLSGKLTARRRATVAGVRRAGDGNRVNTEKVSNAACPARPRRRSPSALKAVAWCSWSATARATATLASTRRLRPLPPAGIAKRPDNVVVDLDARCGDHEPAVALVERLLGDRLHAQTRTLCAHLDLAGPQAELVTQWLGNYQPSCLVDGSSHARTLPSPADPGGASIRPATPTTSGDGMNRGSSGRSADRTMAGAPRRDETRVHPLPDRGPEMRNRVLTAEKIELACVDAGLVCAVGRRAAVRDASRRARA